MKMRFAWLMGLLTLILFCGCNSKLVDEHINDEIAVSGNTAFYASMGTEDRKLECNQKHIEVSGIVSDAGYTLFYIGDEDIDGLELSCSFDEGSDELDAINEGDFISLHGVCDGVFSDTMFIYGCQLISHVKAEDIIIESDTDDTIASEEQADVENSVIIPEKANPLTNETPPVVPELSTFNIHFIDVGQGDAALIECDGHYMLIDGGNKSDSSKIYSILKNASVTKLDIVIGSHAHEDHIGGLPGAYNYTTTDLTLCPVTSYDTEAFEDFIRYANQNGEGITIPRVGDQYMLGSAEITILGVNSGTEDNDTSIVLKVQYGDTSFVFTGDAERIAEQVILDSGFDLSATVLKIGHHGSSDATTYHFLREIMPQYAIISAGEGNSYGHPTDDTLSRLRDADVMVFRTDLQGDIYCSSDGKTVTFKVERNADADTLKAPGSVVIEPMTEPDPIVNPDSEPSKEMTTAPVYDYIGNKNTKKFHYSYCKSVNQMKESNKLYFTGTREQMIGMGYKSCGNCHP